MAVIAGALIFAPRGPVFWGLLAAAVLWFGLFPVIVHGLLGPLERAVLAATPSTAPGLLDALHQQRRVRWFAPFAWTALQEGRLHLVRGEGRASAKALTEAARLAGMMGDPPAGIVSTQAHALLVADVPEQARDLLHALAKRQALGPWDQLHLAAAQLLAGKPRADEVRALLDAAQAALGATPRVLATRALLEQRAGRRRRRCRPCTAPRRGSRPGPTSWRRRWSSGRAGCCGRRRRRARSGRASSRRGRPIARMVYQRTWPRGRSEGTCRGQAGRRGEARGGGESRDASRERDARRSRDAVGVGGGSEWGGAGAAGGAGGRGGTIAGARGREAAREAERAARGATGGPTGGQGRAAGDPAGSQHAGAQRGAAGEQGRRGA
ncbi:hypothetical protein [Nannocystis pusilla]|uniref:hypothetical protein n=1 Tax=Nannocystis pusilla TaxID=889268 RepID=UPI003B7F14E8